MVQPPSPLPPRNTYGELAERLRRDTGVPQSAAEFVEANWKRVLGGIGVVGLLVWIGFVIRDSRLRERGEAALRFSGAQEAFSGILPESKKQEAEKIENEKTVDKTAESKDEAERDRLRGFEDSVRALREAQGGVGAYPVLARLYGAALRFYQGKFAEVEQELKGMPRVSTAVGVDGDRLIREFTSLLEAKAELSAAGELTPSVREQFIALARQSQFVSGEALLVLARLARGEAEQEEVVNLANEAMKAHPGLRAVLEGEFARLGLRSSASSLSPAPPTP